MSKIVKLSDRKKKPKNHSDDDFTEDGLACLQCPYCENNFFAPVLSRTKDDELELRYLMCISEVCQGDVYVAVDDGILEPHFYENSGTGASSPVVSTPLPSNDDDEPA